MSDTAPRHPAHRRQGGAARSGKPSRPPHDDKSTPTPARALLEEAERGEDGARAPEPEETTLELDGEPWRVQIRGRSRTGAATGAAPLLLVAFSRAGDEAPERESLVVGRSLAELGSEALLAAFHRSRPPSDPGSHKEIFPEVGGRRRER